MAANPPTPSSNAASDALDYARNFVESVAPDLQGSFDVMSGSGVYAGVDIAIAEVGIGVTADIVGFEPLGFAAAAMLGMYISGWVLTKVAQFFPNPSFFGFRPLNFLVEGVTNLGAEWEHTALSVADDIKNVIMQPVRVVTGLFQRIGNAIGSAHNKIAVLANTVIPLSVNDGVTRSEAFVTEQVHNIATQVQGAVTRLSGNLNESQAKGLISDAHRYGGIGWDITAIAASAIVAADEYAAAVGKVAASNLDTATKKVAADAQTALNDLHTALIRQLTGDENALNALAQTVSVTVPAEIMAQVTKAQAIEQQRLNDASSKLQGEIDTLKSQLSTLTQRIAADEQVVASANAQISTLQGRATVDETLITAQRQLISTAQSDILSNITSIKDINTTITGISNTLGPVVAAQQLNTTQLSPFEAIGAIALPTVLATLSMTLSNLKTKVDTCTVDTCDPANPNNIRNVLRDLLGLMTAAGEIGFIAEAVRNPEGTANAIAPLLDSIAGGATNTLDTLLGLL